MSDACLLLASSLEGIDDEAVLRGAAAWLDAGQGVALATVTSTWGSAPRPLGSLLAVNGNAEFLGSVSGGCAEAKVIDAALRCIRDGQSRQLSFGVTQERAWEVGMPCGGTIEVHVERVS